MKQLLSCLFSLILVINCLTGQVAIESKTCADIQAQITTKEAEIKALQKELTNPNPILSQKLQKLLVELANLKTSLTSCLAKLPDLYIEGYSSKVINHQWFFSVIVKNKGGATAGNCILLFDIQGQKTKFPFASLPAGQSRTIYDIPWKQVRETNLKVYIDSDNTVIESNGANNILGIPIIF